MSGDDPWRGPGAATGLLERVVAPLGQEDWTVNLVLVDDDRMADLNRAWRGGEGVTDVLSFSYLEEADAGDRDLAGGDRGAARDLRLDAGDGADGAGIVGEVVLAPRFVRERCEREGWDVDAEWPLLVVHGCLHVLGWEHAADDERRTMRGIEAELLAAAGLGHPLRERSDA
jgi:probable rRNA maturation factor